MIVVKIILWTLLALLLIVAAALAVPTRLFVRYTGEPTLQVRYLFLKFTIPVTEEQKARKPVKQKKKKAGKNKKTESGAKKSVDSGGKVRKKGGEKKKKPNAAVKWLKGLYRRGGVEAITEAFKRLASLAGNVLKPVFRHLRIRRLDINIIVASEDAADTAINYGRLCAGVYPALTVLLSVMKYDDYSVNIRPDFDKKALEPDISAEISLVPWIALAGALHELVRFVVFKIKREL